MLNYEKFSLERINEFADSADSPFRHTVIEGLLGKTNALRCYEEMSSLSLEAFRLYDSPGFEYRKHTLSNWTLFPHNLKRLFRELHSKKFLECLETVTGIEGLIGDPELWGGGLHVTTRGGYLAVHRDFTVLPSSYRAPLQKRRVLNLIGYFTPGLGFDDRGGSLELWDSRGSTREASILPTLNRWVLFDTRGSYHGHPSPWLSDQPRLSIAAYYYVEEKVPREEWSSTRYLQLPWMSGPDEYAKERIERADPKLRYKEHYPNE